MHEMSVYLPRSAFSPREAPRAGDLWRLFQDVAVGGSIHAGWPPERYREEGVSFVVRSMVVVHHREAVYGEHLIGRTWPSRFRRGMFFTRECRVGSDARGTLASATQEWVHVTSELALARASDALVDSFPIETHEAPISLPAFERFVSERVHRTALECWHCWMDPLGHVNHPTYIDFCDEAISRAMASATMDPVRLVPIAEEAFFKSGIVAGEQISIATRLSGRTGDGDAVFEHAIDANGRSCARVSTVRRLAGEDGRSSLLALGH